MARAVKFTARGPKPLSRGKLFAYRKLKRKERNNANKNREVPSSIGRRRRIAGSWVLHD